MLVKAPNKTPFLLIYSFPTDPLDIVMRHFQGFQLHRLTPASLCNEYESIRSSMSGIRSNVGLRNIRGSMIFSDLDRDRAITHLYIKSTRSVQRHVLRHHISVHLLNRAITGREFRGS